MRIFLFTPKKIVYIARCQDVQVARDKNLFFTIEVVFHGSGKHIKDFIVAMSVVKRRATGDYSGEEFDVFVVLNDLVVELINVRNIHTAILKENTYKIKSLRKEK